MHPRHLLSYLLHLSLLALTSAVLLSCGEINNNPNSASTSLTETEVEKADGDCEPGILGCRCLRGDFECWDEDAICIGGICREQTCNVGEENCACFANSTCSQTAEGSWLVCGENGICRQPACPQGAEGCGCFAGYQCNEGLFCQDDGQNPPSCVRPNCPAGDLNCGCFPDRSCGVDATGTQLVCEGNTCTRPQCQQGSDGCACNADFSCDGNLLCSNGVCGAPTCVQGNLSCACDPDGSCNEGLSCDANGTCQAINCPQGEVGCGCFPDFTCGVDGESQLLCSAAGRCVRSDCRAGLPDCGCAADGSCVDGYQCRNGFCVEEAPSNPNEPPLEPSIYDLCLTSCKADYTDPVTSEFYPCSADGLMEVCLPKGDVERTCVSGSCVVVGEEEPRRCLGADMLPDESLCPAHQRCDVDGFCASNCRSDNDCFGTRQCHMNVCRMPCDVDTLSCGEGEFCATRDAESGFCMPKVPVEDGAPIISEIRDRFSVDVNLLQFTNTSTKLKVIITNHSDRRIDIPVIMYQSTHVNENGTTIDLPSADQSNSTPLYWINIFAKDRASNALNANVTPQTIQIPHAEEDLVGITPELQPNQVELRIELNTEQLPSKWTGKIKLGDDVYGETFLNLAYAEKPDGRWQGKINYFSNFQTNEDDLTAWMESLRSGGGGAEVPDNPLFQIWANTTTLVVIERRLDDALSNIYEEIWVDNPEDCPNDQYCYQSTREDTGALTYEGYGVTRGGGVLSEPMPTGVMSYPFAVNLKLEDNLEIHGKIDSRVALQYSEEPAFRFKLTTSEPNCNGCALKLTSLGESVVDGTVVRGAHEISRSSFGGRYLQEISSTGELVPCANGYQSVPVPWLIEGLKSTSVIDSTEGLYIRYQCRSTDLPLADNALTNMNLTMHNPLLDGQSRDRVIEMIDGAIIGGDRIVILFRERFESFVPAEDGDIFAYGVIDITKQPADLDESAYVTSARAPIASQLVDETSTTCSDDILAELAKLDDQADPSSGYQLSDFEVFLDDPLHVADAIWVLINGIAESGLNKYASNSTEASQIQQDNFRTIHYLCHDTGRIDGCVRPVPGVENLDPQACPAGSKVTFFVLNDEAGYRFRENQICELSCNYSGAEQGSCAEYLGVNNNDSASGSFEGAAWLAQHSDSNQLIIPNSMCSATYQSNDVEVICDDDRLDLRTGLDFYIVPEDDEKPQFNSVYSDIVEAFKYRTRFQNRDGIGLGFTPAICDPSTDNLRYCYNPEEIENIRSRINCLQWIYNGGDNEDRRRFLNKLIPTDVMSESVRSRLSGARTRLDAFMKFNFGVSYIRSSTNTPPVRIDGFEKLYAELLIMQGQEMYTNALRARFDLAGIRGARFPGSLFEDQGMDLSGTAGFEMYNLYKSIQYYDFALEQFYNQLSVINGIVSYERGVNSSSEEEKIITSETVEEYYNKLILASTEKSRVWSEIARKYQAFNRADLARNVLERGYISVYTESIIFNNLIANLINKFPNTERDQTQVNLEQMKISYDYALRTMREVYINLSDEPRVFGELDPSYIPFPSLSPQESNAFEKIMTSVRRKLSTASIKEDRALNESRSFDTDTAVFQQELTRLRNSYEGQLGDICGTFQAENGRIYPAVKRYAHLDPNGFLPLLHDPCGSNGTGALYQHFIDLELLQADFIRLEKQYSAELEKIQLKRQYLADKCQLNLDDANLQRESSEQISSLNDDIRGSRKDMQQAQDVFQRIQDGANIGSACSQTPPNPGACNGALVIFAKRENIKGTLDQSRESIDEFTKDIEELERETAYKLAVNRCASYTLDTELEINAMYIDLRMSNLDAAKLVYRQRSMLAEIQALKNKAKRLISEQKDAEQMAIDVEAARNNPNIRIYRNDAVQEAQRTFESARLEAYKATRVFEYYSSQSYEPLNDLFLIRMVSRGTPTLEAYIDELEDAFNDFEESFGISDLRVDVLSVRDDILRIPFTEDDVDLSQKTRVELFREELTDNRLLDRNGYRVIPFSLGVSRLSPLTRNHKISHIEAEFVGARIGDSVGRLYLRNSGTSIVQPLEGFMQYYRFPEHIAVINTFFNGQKVFPAELYQNQRLRDRPYLNSRWELILNQVDERANQDIDLNSLTDIKLYVYYRDFTDY